MRSYSARFFPPPSAPKNKNAAKAIRLKFTPPFDTERKNRTISTRAKISVIKRVIFSAFFSAFSSPSAVFANDFTSTHRKILPPSNGYAGNKLTSAIESEEKHAVSVNAYMVGANHQIEAKNAAVKKLQSGPHSAIIISSFKASPRISPSITAPNGIRTILFNRYPSLAAANACAHSCCNAIKQLIKKRNNSPLKQ